MNFTDWKGNLILRLEYTFKDGLQDAVLSRPLRMGHRPPAAKGHEGSGRGYVGSLGFVEGQSIHTTTVLGLEGSGSICPDLGGKGLNQDRT